MNWHHSRSEMGAVPRPRSHGRLSVRVLAARSIRINGKELVLRNPGGIQGTAEHGGVKNQPALRALPDRPGMTLGGASFELADDEPNLACVHFRGEPEAFRFAIAALAGFSLFRWLRDVGLALAERISEGPSLPNPLFDLGRIRLGPSEPA